MSEIYREQDGHLEIVLEPVGVLQRRVRFARLRAEGWPVRVVAIMMAMDCGQARKYEARRCAAAALYQAMRP
jgi:hypothetical protein